MISLLNCTTYSLLKSFTQPEDLVKRAKKNGATAVGLCDSNLSGIIEFQKACQKQDVKSIIGQRFKIQFEDNTEFKKPTSGEICLFAQNLNGYKELLSLAYESNFRPLTIDDLSGKSNLVCVTGALSSDIGQGLFNNPGLIYNLDTYDDVKGQVLENWESFATNRLQQYKDIFGDKLFLQSQVADNSIAGSLAANRTVRYLAKKLGIKAIGANDCYYLNRNDSPDQRILLCSYTKSTLPVLKEGIQKSGFNELLQFLSSNSYYLHSQEELNDLYKSHPHELSNLNDLADMVETFSLLRPPEIPKFNCPNGLSSDEYLRELCRKGWSEKVSGFVDKSRHNEYAERVKYELEVLQGAGLSNYFLIVQDYVRAAKERDELVGIGRGSSAGSLVNYLIDVTNIDPIKYTLFFERFYNAGRNSPGNIALPDIDVDFPKHKRQNTFDYLRNKYGLDKVAQITTFGRLMGKSALKEVLRCHNACGFDEQNKMTENMPDEAEISDDLEEMRLLEELPSIIMWTLEERADKLKEYCYIDNENRLQGPFAKYFEQAVRLEKTKKSAGKHASAVYISPHVLRENFPMTKDKSSDEMLIYFDMKSAEMAGLPKFDILSINALDKMMLMREL